MSELATIIGPPGTGKTTTLLREAVNATKAGHSVVIMSLTRSAILEAIGRLGNYSELNIDQVGTIHSFCYRALANGAAIQMTHTEKALREFFSAYPYIPIFAGANISTVEDFPVPKSSDPLSQYFLSRERCQPLTDMSSLVQSVGNSWETWKTQTNRYDFQDLVSKCIDEVPEHPNQPDVIFVDEAQDLSQLEFKLIRKWMDRTWRTVIIGDPDQAIYQWRGADPLIFSEAPVGLRRVLTQSYRVPTTVHALAMKTIQRVSNRIPIEYKPTTKSGSVERCDFTSSAEKVADLLEARVKAHHGTVMFIASCLYMVQPVIYECRERGIPIHNPFRRKDRMFNPLGFHTTPAGQTSSRERLLSFLSFGDTSTWTPDDMMKWAPLFKLKAIKTETSKLQRKHFEKEPPTTHIDEFIDEHINLDLIVAIIESKPDVIFQSLQAVYQTAMMRYLLKVWSRFGSLKPLMEAPRIIVGTIHSVKGGEADEVVLMPDVSPASQKGFDVTERIAAADSQARLFYVAITRARQALYLLKPSSHNFYDF